MATDYSILVWDNPMDRGVWQATVHGLPKSQTQCAQSLLSCLSLSSCLTLCDPMDCSHQAPLSMGFSRQESWSGLPFHSPGDLPDPGIEPRSPTLQADALTSEPPGKPFII